MPRSSAYTDRRFRARPCAQPVFATLMELVLADDAAAAAGRTAGSPAAAGARPARPSRRQLLRRAQRARRLADVRGAS